MTLISSYQNAMATIRRVMTTDFHFQLVVTRVFEEGEELLLDEDDESSYMSDAFSTRD